jgi:hypothetical protein
MHRSVAGLSCVLLLAAVAACGAGEEAFDELDGRAETRDDGRPHPFELGNFTPEEVACWTKSSNCTGSCEEGVGKNDWAYAVSRRGESMRVLVRQWNREEGKWKEAFAPVELPKLSCSEPASSRHGFTGRCDFDGETADAGGIHLAVFHRLASATVTGRVYVSLRHLVQVQEGAGAAPDAQFVVRAYLDSDQREACKQVW